MAEVEIAVVGSCNMDLITYASRLPLSGETIHGHKYSTGFGGKGANQCVAAAKLGAKTAMIGKLGNDANGKNFVKNFKSFDINTQYLYETDKSATGVAAITVGDDGANSIVIVSGANLLLMPMDVTMAQTVLEKAQVMLCQLEVPIETTLKALQLAKSLNVLTIFNPSPIPSDGLSSEFYSLSTVLCLNECEASSLTGINVVDEKSAKQAVVVLVDKGCEIVTLTMGEKGCIYMEKGSSLPGHVIPEKVDAVDTTGAGDAFAGALAFFMLKFPNLSLHEKISRCCFIASYTVCRNGTQCSYPTVADLPSITFSNNNAYEK